MRKTKIVCTLGPSTDKEGVLRDMICAGMNVARFNFSHGTHEDHARRLAQLQKLRDELDMPVAALLDTKGPEIRLRDFKNGKVQLKAGQTFTLTTREVLGDENICSISYKELPQDVCPGARILLDECKCDFIKIIAKIENREGVNNIEEILAVSDGIMVARGDMGVEIDFTEIPIIQKDIIWRCYNAGKPVITATQMLESMMEHPRPTRAEITDVANAIYDGTSAIMLSGETAAGRWPVQAVQTMAAIAWRTESDINYGKRLRQRTPEAHMSVADAVAHAACTTAMDIHANAIITVTKSGETARLLCKYRPNTDILACTLTRQVFRQLSLSWGITPLCMEYAHNTDELIDKAVATAKKAQMVADGDLVVLTAGVPVGISGTTNMIKAHLVGDALLTGVGVGSKNGTGRACVCHNAEEANHKCKDGDVLVVPATDNEMLTAVRHAAAIITEEAGANSHAAIVGLTLGKPVIVGALGATRKLEDGMHISVDAERGVVRAMPD